MNTNHTNLVEGIWRSPNRPYTISYIGVAGYVNELVEPTIDDRAEATRRSLCERVPLYTYKTIDWALSQLQFILLSWRP
jgi:hypothetical protein